MAITFLYLNGSLQDEEGLYKYGMLGLMCAVPGSLIGVYIRMRTKKH